MERSQSIANLAKALNSFHSKVSKIKKDSKNPHFKSTYASLPQILDAVAEPLIESGLVVTQWPIGVNGLVTYLVHQESGEFMASTYEMIGQKNTPQERGSFITYQRRYSLLSVLNLNVSDGEDDDGNAATFGTGKGPIAEVKEEDDKPWLNIGSKEFNGAVEKMKAGKSSIQAIRNYFKISKKTEAALLEQCQLDF